MGFLLVATAFAAGCGGSDSNTTPTKLAMSISEQGKSATIDAPKSVKGGLVELTFTNDGKGPHSAQLVRVEGNHTTKEALAAVESQSPKTPEWGRAEGGTGTVSPGKSVSTTVNLPAGKYVVVDQGGSGGPPAYADFEVTKGDNGDLPHTDATIVADHTGKDKYAWDISGLKAGKNEITFESKGDEAIHHIVAFKLTGKATDDQIKKALESNGPPPPFISPGPPVDTAVLDGGKSEVTQFDLPAGNYAFVCFLSDRDGGKPHFEEGLLKQVEVK